MPGSAEFVQRIVHTFETGSPVIWLRNALVVAAIAALSLVYMSYEFRGLATSQAMDQAQIGREIARGHGWRTQFARPRGIGQLLAHGKDVPRKNLVRHLQRAAAAAGERDRAFSRSSRIGK